MISDQRTSNHLKETTRTRLRNPALIIAESLVPTKRKKNEQGEDFKSIHDKSVEQSKERFSRKICC